MDPTKKEENLIDQQGKNLSRAELKKIKEAKKAAKKKAKLEKKLKKAEEEAKRGCVYIDYVTKATFGDVKLIQSQTNNYFTFTEIQDIDTPQIGKEIRVRGRIHRSKVPGSLAFVTLRKGYYSIQGTANKTDVGNDLIKYIKRTPREQIVDLVGTVVKPDTEVSACSQSKVEIKIKKFFVISRSKSILPFQIEDAQRTMTRDEFNKVEVEGEEETAEKNGNEQKMPTVKLKHRLNNRVLDLRVPTNRAVFKVQSYVCHLFREYLMGKDFVEIHSPKILGGSSEGGAEVFKTDYFGTEAQLAQSPQLFKQMSIMGDFGGVFEIGPVFRAEKQFTPRHLCEFTGLDMEMEIKESYFEVMEVIGELFVHIFKGLKKHCAKELEVVGAQFPFKDFEFLEKTLMLTFEEGVKLLKDEAGLNQDLDQDLSTENERELGKIIKAKYKTDFYILHRYPEEARPFYTMLCGDDPKWTCSYDVFMRGEEIISGAQRVHDTEMIKERAKAKGMNPDDISYYCDSFKYGAWCHGGFGTGLERVVKLFLDLHNVRQTSLFPRTPDHLVP